MNQIRFIRRVLYSLKHEYGFDGIITRDTLIQKDYVSGTVASTEATFYIKKIIRLPNDTSRISSLDMLFGKFSSGAKVDKNTRLFIMDKQLTYIPKMDDTIALGSSLYKIIKIEELDLQLGYLITGQQNV